MTGDRHVSRLADSSGFEGEYWRRGSEKGTDVEAEPGG
jgi:hypothetical protein